jgi:electron transport complex protein RnfC
MSMTKGPTGTWTFNPEPPRPDWGVRAPSLKSLTTRRAIVVAPPPLEVTLPLLQGPGPEAQALVGEGERVRTGQLVARSALGVTMHASITGTVIAVARRAVPAATPREAGCILIRGDGLDDPPQECGPALDPSLMSPREICDHVAAGGIVGLGGALFPTALKLAPGVPIRALIIDGAECEPWITCDEMLLRERTSLVLEGTRIMMRALGTDRAIVAIETDMPEARVAIHDALKEAGDDRIGMAVVTAKYPAGGERQLIELITGDEVPAGGLPRDIGYVCQNVATAAAVAELFRDGRPMISRIVTVTGSGITEPGNFEARIGTPIRDLVALAGGYARDPQRLIMGGPMMGFALTSDELPVTKATNCIVAALRGEVAPAKPELPCIRCGECVQVCPARLLPQELLAAARRRDFDRLDRLGLFDCIECGCCDYVCPSYIQLTRRFIAAKDDARERSGQRATP